MSSPSTTDSRDAIFARIREALTNTAAPLHHHGIDPATVTPESAIGQWLPPVGATFDEQLALFAQISIDLKTEFKAVVSIDEAAAHLNTLAAENQWTKVATHHGTLNDAVTAKLSSPVYRVDETFDKNALETCSAGITECEALVAQTGSVCLTTRSSGGRSISVLPPHHVVLARRSQLIADLPAAYALLKQKYGAAGYPSFISFTTGPSRTGDIERILVLGAHGPKKLTVLLLPD